jgi:hypothetical protein
MASAKQDFERFVEWLHHPEREASSNVRRLANLFLQDFDRLSQTSRQHSQRSLHIVNSARQSLANTSDTPPNLEQNVEIGVRPWRRLRSLTLGPFRGFRVSVEFDLRKRITLMYGPNGSGKTSFCEGLEYALLGSVEEADSKRINSRLYLRNTHERRFSAPTLKATNDRDQEIDVVANLDLYRFCFIEKNRIDTFSRIASRPPAQRTELIATLFGMDKFNEFVGHFNESIENQLVLSGTKQLLLTTRSNTLVTDQALVADIDQVLIVLAGEEKLLAETYSPNLSYADLPPLMGTAEVPGRLQTLNDRLNAVPPARLGLSRESLFEGFAALHKNFNEFSDLIAKLEARSNQVSFKSIYTAVLALQDEQGDHCPACDTPLTGAIHTAINPYEKAKWGLEALKELGALQDQRKVAEETFKISSRSVRRQLDILLGFLATHQALDTPVGVYISKLPVEPAENWWSDIDGTPGENVHALTLEQFLVVADLIAEQDVESTAALQDRQTDIEERDRLVALRLAMQAQDSKRQQAIDNVAAARARISAFDETNAGLIAEVAQEILDIGRDTPINRAYDSFLAFLRIYRDQLPGTLMAGLNDVAMGLYNQFNRNDHDADKIAALHLPLTSNDKIEITFRGIPGARIDALQILSEGHVRCLGLAILLAKGLNIQSPLIVFDDAINAIDHDHRGGIRETIFESEHFLQAQIIVTCHSSEFIKDIEQHLPAVSRRDSQVYLLRHHEGNYQPRVQGNIPTRNYVTKARDAKNLLNDRDALAASRQALEMFCEKIWKWLGSHEHGLISLQIAGVGAEPALRTLCDALRAKLETTPAFEHANKAPVIEALRRVLGIPAANLIWTYLNKGTHEEADREDFDSELVELVVVTLEQLDRLDLRPER